MFLARSFLFAVFLCVCAAGAQAQTGCVPNPNDNGPPFTDGCRISAVGLNKINANTEFTAVGCVGDGVTDDTVCLQNAINTVTTPVLFLPKLYRITANITVPNTLTLLGTGKLPALFNAGWGPTMACTSGIHVTTANITALTLNAPSSKIDGLCIDNSTITNTSGTTVSMPATSSKSTIQNSEIIGGCISIDLSGSVTQQNLKSNILGNVIIPVSGAGCSSIRLGAVSVNGQTTDVWVQNNQILCPFNPNTVSSISLTDGMLLIDVGGAFISHNDIVSCNHGTYVFPGLNQSVQGIVWNGTVLGDTSNANDFLIDTADATAIIGANSITGSWMSGSTGNASVLIQNTANSPIFSGIHFVGNRIYPRVTQSAGALVTAGTDITFQGNAVCISFSSSATMLFITTSGFVSIVGNLIGGCDTRATVNYSVPDGIVYSPTTLGSAEISGNNFERCTVPILYNPTVSANAIIKDNRGVDDVYLSVAGQASNVLGIPPNPTMYVSSAFNIATIQGISPNGTIFPRTITMIPTGTFTIVTTGNIANSVTVTTNVPIIGTWDIGTGKWYLK